MPEPIQRGTTEFLLVPRLVRDVIIQAGCKRAGLFVRAPNSDSDEKNYFFIRCLVGGYCAIARNDDCKGSHPITVQKNCPDGISVKRLAAIGQAASGILHTEFDVKVTGQ